MKKQITSQKGFIIPLIIIIFAALAISGGVYVYHEKKLNDQMIAPNTMKMNGEVMATTSVTNTTPRNKTSINTTVNTDVTTGSSSTVKTTVVVSTTTTNQITTSVFKDIQNNIQFSYPSNWAVEVLPAPAVVAETNAGYKIYKKNDSSQIILSGNANVTSCYALKTSNPNVTTCYQINPNNPWSLFYTTSSDIEVLNVLNNIKTTLTAGASFQG